MSVGSTARRILTALIDAPSLAINRPIELRATEAGLLRVDVANSPLIATQAGTARVAAALPAAGAYDPAPIEIDNADEYKFLTLVCSYTRGAAGGSVRLLPEFALTIVGVDYWGIDAVVNTGAFAAGTDVNSEIQVEDFLYTSTGAGAELFNLTFDIARKDKIRIPCAEVGVVLTPGTMAIYYKLSN